ncbi:MAG: hypothetical protein MUF36_11665 [Bacteroidales bacterium]|jgi:hypothetical protein|nr:hypothetical protein [Bacteroidales bacterium]
MEFEILFGVIVLALIGYIIYLHIQLAKKNMFIESTVKRFSGIEKSWSSEELMKFLREVKKAGHYGSYFIEKLFDEKPLGFLLENQKDSRIYIHYTKEEADAKNILKEGFRFADTFYKTALPVFDDRLDLLIKHNGRKSFGDYMIVICLADKLFDHYASEIDRMGLKDFSVENILTESPPFKNENADFIYQLSNKFVKGYINHQTGDIIPNPDFNPAYNSDLFEKNLEILAERNKN